MAHKHPADSATPPSTLRRKEVYPDSVDDDDVVIFSYNRQGQVTTRTDQNGTVHSYDYDLLGRMTQDRVTTVGSGIDDTVLRIGTTYEVRGLQEKVTSYDNAAVGTGNVLNDVLSKYNDFGQLTREYQEHEGSVNVGTTPSVQYDYADGSENTIRQTLLVYPNGRELTYSYGEADGITNAASRVAAIVDEDDTHLVAYEYLGRETFVVADDTEPQVKWTLVDLDGEDDPDTGDIYSGLDRFGRIKDNRWYNYDAEEDVDRLQYGYDRAGNRTSRANLVAEALSKEFDELYNYDGIHRLKDMGRGLLNGPRTALTSQSFAQCWTLDSTGNWSKMKQADTGTNWTLEQTRTASDVNEINNITNAVGPSWVQPAYDPAGNMTTIPDPDSPSNACTARYDSWGHVVALTTGEEPLKTYRYDGRGRSTVTTRYIDETSSDIVNIYYSVQWQPLEERINGDPSCRVHSTWGVRYIDNILVRDRDVDGHGSLDSRLYCTQDANWNTTAIFTGEGAVDSRYVYTAYGTPSKLTPGFDPASEDSDYWAFLFSGYTYDGESHLYQVRHRILHSQLGVWCQRDPLLYYSGANLSTYLDPLNAVDPLGLEEFVYRPTNAADFLERGPGRGCAATGRDNHAPANEYFEESLISQAEQLLHSAGRLIVNVNEGGYTTLRPRAEADSHIENLVAGSECCDLYLFGHRGNGSYEPGGPEYLNPGGFTSEGRRLLPDPRLEQALARIFRQLDCTRCRITLFACGGNASDEGGRARDATARYMAGRTGCTICVSDGEDLEFDKVSACSGAPGCVSSRPFPPLKCFQKQAGVGATNPDADPEFGPRIRRPSLNGGSL